MPPGSIPHALFFVSHWTLEQEINNPLLFRLSLTKLSALPSLDGQQLPRRWPVGGGTFRRTGSAHCRLLRLGECRAAQRLGCRHCKARAPRFPCPRRGRRIGRGPRFPSHAAMPRIFWMVGSWQTNARIQLHKCLACFFFPSKMSGRSELNVEEAENFNKGEIRTMSHRPHIWSNRWCAPPTAVSSPSLAYGLWRRLRRAAVTAACSPAHPQYQARPPPTHLQVAPPRADAGAAPWQIKETWHG